MERQILSKSDIHENKIKQHKKIFDILQQQSCEASSSQASEMARLANRQKRLSKYEDEAKKYQEKEKDHRPSDFNQDFKTEIQYKKGTFHIISENDHGKYENVINISEGQIIGYRNDSKNTQKWHLSDIIYNQLLLVLQKAEKDISLFDLKSWYGNEITNKNTKSIVKYLLGYKNSQTFKAGSKEFNEIAVSDAAQSKFFLLAQYPKAFKDTNVTSITVIRYSDGQINIEYKFGSQLEQEEKASPND
jgi:hypothetical protein